MKGTTIHVIFSNIRQFIQPRCDVHRFHQQQPEIQRKDADLPVLQLFYGASSLVLKGYSAVVQSSLALVRNILAIRKIHSDILEWIILILGIVLGIAFNNLGLLGYLPVIANGLYTFSIFRISHNQTALRWAFLIYLVLYAIFDLFILNYVGAAATAIAIVSTAVSIVRNR